MQKPKPLVLLVDRESEATRALAASLRDHDFDVVWARDGESAVSVLAKLEPDMLVTELKVQRIDGLSVLRRARERNPEVCAVVITDGAPIEAAVEAMRAGAYDVQRKPIHPDQLLAVLQRGLSHQALVTRVAAMEGRLDERFGLERLTGRSRAIARVREQVRQTASSRATVLIEGEPGTGKGVVAQAIHHNGPRTSTPFVWVNCGARGPGEMESDLFGDERAGDAPGPRRGRIEQAHGGTLFLDDVDATPLPVQMRLLRVLQERSFERVGGSTALRSDVRLIAASTRGPTDEAGRSRLRDDLYQRLSVVRIALSPLRERAEDMPLLVEEFIRQFNREHGRRVTGVTRGTLERLVGHPWPGNVRELRNTIEGMVVFASGRRPLDLSDLPASLRDVVREGARLDLAVGMTVGEAERKLVTATLQHTGNDKVRAAAMLGIGLRTLYRKIKQYGLR